MPPAFTSRRISDTEYRLKLLLCVDVLGMVTREQLWPFVAKLELMEYIPMCMYVDELLRDGALATGVYATEGELFLTGEGRSMLKLFKGTIPQSDRERIQAYAPTYRDGLNDKQQIRAGYELAPRGRSRCLCTLVEGELPVILLRVDTSDPAYVSAVIRRFSARATELLMCLYAVQPTDDEALPIGQPTPEPLATTPQDAMETATPEQPALCSFGKHEHMAAVVLPYGDTEYRVALMMPSKAAACAWAATMQRECEPMAEKLHALFAAKESE